MNFDKNPPAGGSKQQDSSKAGGYLIGEENCRCNFRQATANQVVTKFCSFSTLYLSNFRSGASKNNVKEQLEERRPGRAPCRHQVLLHLLRPRSHPSARILLSAKIKTKTREPESKLGRITSRNISRISTNSADQFQHNLVDGLAKNDMTRKAPTTSSRLGLAGGAGGQLSPSSLLCSSGGGGQAWPPASLPPKKSSGGVDMLKKAPPPIQDAGTKGILRISDEWGATSIHVRRHSRESMTKSRRISNEPMARI
ncbi:unnamed protein product [Nesidiocoris tenuis]|uniref:Uncharacterized protein n=1 Tax=Nesidiocoris tenuis TaxID=355587 RepID=A0A6H5HTF0_9HEMI|nr:unnamed protein product [Nesidiocoris tenuis]